ncbi:MAG: hypothetical protein EXR00_07270 [Alphaproteobacteria bacterium]|nr:hypothetical protein [Alphaproteobacteria bacterium]
MFKHYPVYVALVSCVLAPLLQGAAAAPPMGEIIGDDMYVNCAYRVAAHFPSDPKFRDINFRLGARTAPARQFYFERPEGLLSVTVAHLPDAPMIDQQLIETAADTLRRRGEVRYDSSVWYDEPTIPGRQLNIALAQGRVLRGSVYMADHRLYITEAISEPNDFPAFLFEQSVSLINENGTDLDSNPIGLATNGVGTSAGLPNRQYDCGRINRRR